MPAHRTQDGLSHHPLYGTWDKMRRRCNQSTYKQYPYYGGRGITVDPRWDSFKQFLEDMGDKPGPGYTLDRIDNDGPYTPDNCRWATTVEQNMNTRKFKGEVSNVPVYYRTIIRAVLVTLGVHPDLVWILTELP